MNKVSEIKQLYDTVIKGDYCIGCGACATIEGSPFKININEYGNYVAYIDNIKDSSDSADLLSICPFSGVSKNEDELGEIFFPENIKDGNIGNYLKCFAGFVAGGDYRSQGSSGGFGKWLGYILLKENLIDYFVQIVANNTMRPDVPLFDYKIFDSANEVITGSKSAYYPTTLEQVINIVKEKDGRYAITGVPCFIKTLRLLSIQNKVLSERIHFTIGIFCGGMKSANQAKMIGWHLGVNPNNLVAIDFRRKFKDKPASHKIYQVWSNNDSTERYKTDRDIPGTDFGASYFKPNACDYCDDVVSETADISLGDAWLPQFVTDPGGTSIIIVRNNTILQVINKYKSKGDLHLDEISKELVVKSQEGGYRHRREALSFRLMKKARFGEWVPKKRVNPNQFKITARRKKIYTLREEIAKTSHTIFFEALQKDDFSVFVKGMMPLINKYKQANHRSIIYRGLRKIKRMYHKF